MSVYDQIFIVKNNRSMSLNDWFESLTTVRVYRNQHINLVNYV